MTNLVFNDSMEKRTVTRYIIIHHSAVMSRHSVEDVHRWHQKRKWAGIGYHYFIDKDGKVFNGRPVDTVGAHAKAYNRDSIGVCFEGDFTKETMKGMQLSNEAIELLFLLELVYDIQKSQKTPSSQSSCEMTELVLNKVTGEFEAIKPGNKDSNQGPLLFCDELVGYQGAPLKGFPKKELLAKLNDYADWFYTEQARVSGGIESGRFNDWLDSECAKFGIMK